MAQVTVSRLQLLVQELGQMMKEGDGEASVAFALKVNTTLEQLRPALEASNKTRQQIGLKHCDKDRKGEPILAAQDALKFSTTPQREALDQEAKVLNESAIDVPVEPNYTREELKQNGIATNLGRLIALSPILAADPARDEPT